MKTPSHRNSWIVTVPLAAAAVAYVMFSLLPDRRAVGEIRQQIRKKQDYVVQVGGLTGVLHAAEEELQETRAYSAAWRQSAPDPRDLSGVFGKIHETARTAGTTIMRFDPEPVVYHERIGRTPVAVSCVGSFSQICAFLERLEELPQTIWAEELEFRRSGQDGQSVSCNLALVVFTGDLEDSDYVE
jgi:Tfp pilus assembly protein PilO